MYLILRCSNKKCSFFFTLPVSNDTVKCPKCKETVTLTENLQLLEWCEDQYSEGFKAATSNEQEKAIQILCPALDTFHR